MPQSHRQHLRRRGSSHPVRPVHARRHRFGNWLRTKERKKIVHLSTPLRSGPQAIISTKGITSDDLDGKVIGSVAGNLYNNSLQKWLSDKFKVYQDDESIYADLKAGRID